MAAATNPQPVSASNPAKSASRAQAAIDLWNKTPKSLRFAAPIALLFAAVLALYLLWGVGESFVALQVHHSFKSAELKVLVDGSVKHSTTLSGTSSRKLFGGKTVGVYSKQLALRPGHHTIEVRITSQGVEQSRTLSADFTRDGESVLDVSSVRSGIFMSLHDPLPHAAATTSGTIRSNPLTSMLFTLCGSALSAILGFYVQEFLRKRRDVAK